MAKSLLDQLNQVSASVTYDDLVASPHTSAVSEGQTHVEGDLNVIRTNMKDLKGTTNWYDDVTMNVDDIGKKQFIYRRHEAGFDTIVLSGGNTNNFDSAIKGISGHNNGAGDSVTDGVIVNSTLAHKLRLRSSTTNDPFDSSTDDEVYGRLTWSGSEYIVTFYYDNDGVETAYSFSPQVSADMALILVSENFADLPWSQFQDVEFHDTVGQVGTITDDSVIVDGMTDLYTGLTTQAQVNAKGDDLGSTANGEGASLIKIEDTSTWYTGTDIEAALNELETLLGATTSTTYNFTENNVLADNDAVYAALNKLDLKWEFGTAIQEYNRGETTQVPTRFTVKLKSRYRGTISAEGRTVHFEGDTNAR